MEGKKKFRPNSDLKLMDQVREVLRYYHYAYRTEQTYCDWIKRYFKFHGMKRHPQEMGTPEVERYLSELATKGKVAASTQRQALNAIVFLYREVLDIDLGEIAHIRSKRQRHPPTVLTQEEVRRVLRNMEGTHRLMAQLLYGCGLRETPWSAMARHRFYKHPRTVLLHRRPFHRSPTAHLKAASSRRTPNFAALRRTCWRAMRSKKRCRLLPPSLKATAWQARISIR